MAKAKPLPDRETLNRLLDYDHQTGVLRWKPRPLCVFSGKNPSLACSTWNKRFAGQPAFGLAANGYLTSKVAGVNVSAQRVAFKIYYGRDPIEVDHINGDRADNSIRNLRDVGRADNARNRRLSANNNSGSIGVSWDNERGKWRATVSENGRRVSVGRFNTVEEAEEARIAHPACKAFHRNHGRKHKI